jgi:hypothetical protein
MVFNWKTAKQVLPLAEPCHRALQRIAQAKRGQRDRVVRVVLQEPELVPAPDIRVGLEAVVHLRPARTTLDAVPCTNTTGTSPGR